eukprot:6401013-Pyramimonas_sp.AAC.1
MYLCQHVVLRDVVDHVDSLPVQGLAAVVLVEVADLRAGRLDVAPVDPVPGCAGEGEYAASTGSAAWEPGVCGPVAALGALQAV